ncbi:superoxide dismutase [Anaeromicrobium sediminis]|uniref:superoxide dismutase n=1 Tax=Anaeromicrobium sediminis TaxID=1478221 RepID=A0A267MHZ1_9FIRM|nr:Fe-Mn family superoxide dismutase [Anaeromicrobium sediminis]PAB58413.1 hypothetical protein CCE28_14980 [Anaeromicrobium sediminis]
MYKEVTAKKFDFASIKGITTSQLKQHYKLYEGYVGKTNKMFQKLEDINNYKKPNSTYSSIRSIELGQSYALNGVKLHEFYFDNMGDSNIPYGNILDLINKKYGGFDVFMEKFKSVGMAVRGWVILALDSIDEDIHIFGCDAHDVGSIWYSYPLLVMDVYEHAYMIDFGINRRKYIDVFFQNIDWKKVNKRLDKALR